jgi:hypothetical protein
MCGSLHEPKVTRWLPWLRSRIRKLSLYAGFGPANRPRCGEARAIVQRKLA